MCIRERENRYEETKRRIHMHARPINTLPWQGYLVLFQWIGCGILGAIADLR